MSDLLNPNIQKAVAFFTQAGLSRLLVKLREKYIKVGHIGGQIALEHALPDERRNIASFLGKPPYPASSFKVKLVEVEKALLHSFHCTLPELLTAFFPDQPLVTRQAQQNAHATRQTAFLTALKSIATELPEGSRGKQWLLYGQHGQDWLFSRYKNATEEEQVRHHKQISYIANALDQLPNPDAPERIALFAQRTSGDPHALDPDRTAGRLFLLALNDLAGNQVQVPVTTSSQDRGQTLRLYNTAGLLVDMISSNVAVFNVAGAIFHNDTPDPLVQAAGKRVLLLPLRQLLEWRSTRPATADIYVLENPQVFEEVIAILEAVKVSHTLVCTSGWPSVAALTLLDLLLAESPDNLLHYSGDFDVKGLQIAAHLMARYQSQFSLWHFDPASYLLALLSDGVQARTSELDILNTFPDVFAPLLAIMQEKGKWAYQEGIVDLLAADVYMRS